MPLLEITWWELIALLGLSQTVYLLVYMVIRAGRLSNSSLALLCFSGLLVAFLADFGTRYLDGIAIYPLLQDTLWYAVPIFSVLLAMQIAKVDGFPEPKYLGLIALIPLAALVGWGLGSFQDNCHFMSMCDVTVRRNLFAVCGIVAGAVSLLCLWSKRGLLDKLIKEKSYKSDRYWLILALIVMNCGLICLTLSYVSGMVKTAEFLLIREVLGCGLVYLASTSLFRIYPQVIRVSQKFPNEFNAEEVVLAKKLEDLMVLQKVYQEPSYSRGDLARELGTSEAVVTRLVNIHFGKSVPQLLNEKRIEDAKRMLEQTEAAVSLIAEQVGFNSVPSFNRVFKEVTGQSPSEYRDAKAPAARHKA